MRIPRIQSTKNYEKFKKFKSNREVNKAHLKRLMASIKQKNLLYLFPIVVNSSLEIVDGQHRLAAAIELGVPIYYLIDSRVNKADIAMVNTNRKGWGSMDFINYYQEEGHKEYKHLKALVGEFKIPIMCAVRLITGNVNSYYSGGNLSSMLRAGKLNGDDYATGKKCCEIARDIKPRVHYAMKPDVLLDIKWGITKFDVKPDRAHDLIRRQSVVFPLHHTPQDNAVRNALRQILEPRKGHSKEEVEEILKKHNAA